MADYTYEDYKHALISIGEAKLMDLSYNWDKKLFNRKMTKQIVQDETLTSDQTHAIMALANSYLESSLFLQLMKHKNFDKKNVKYFIENLNPSPVMIEQFYKNIIRYNLWNDSSELSRVMMQNYFSIDKEYLVNERALREVPELVNNLIHRYEGSHSSERLSYVIDKVLEASLKYPKIMDILMKYYDETESTTFLPTDTTESFIF